MSNYRPISLLPLVSKVLERQVYNAIMSHLVEHGLLSDMQFGFRPGASTQEAILAATQAWHGVLEKGGSVACVFLDLSKAFDSLPHSLILHSLSRVGICGELHSWIADYLTGRSQRVVLHGAESPAVSVSSGVPQGSILGPLLFILSVDMLASLSISSSGKIGMYADDICYYRPVFAEEDLLAVQLDVSLINEWVKDCGLRLNVAKTKSMVISRKRRPPTLSLRIDDRPIDQVDSFRYLGVQISSDLTWSDHISRTCLKAKRLIGFLYRYFYLAERKCLSHLYRALILPILDYGCCIWDPHTAKHVTQLERVQSFAARLATKRWSCDADSLKSELGWAALSTRRRFQKLCLCRRILCGDSLIPPTVFTPHPSLSVRHLNSKPLFQPFVRTYYHRYSYFVSVVPLWNAIPDRIITLSSGLAFKRHLKQLMVL